MLLCNERRPTSRMSAVLAALLVTTWLLGSPWNLQRNTHDAPSNSREDGLCCLIMDAGGPKGVEKTWSSWDGTMKGDTLGGRYKHDEMQKPVAFKLKGC